MLRGVAPDPFFPRSAAYAIVSMRRRFSGGLLKFVTSILGIFLAGLTALHAGSDPVVDDRATALWVIRQGGRVLLAGQTEYTVDPFDLPTEAVRIIGVDMHGTLADPRDLEPLSHLKDLRDLNLPGRVWTPASGVKSKYSDEMFDYFANSKKLEKFEAGLTPSAALRLGEAGLKRLAPLSQLTCLRLSLITIKDPATLAPFVNLETLDLNDAYVTDELMPGLVGLKKLRRLTLVGTLITDEGLKYLQDLTTLEELDLWGVRISDAGVPYLRKLTRLRRLNLLGAQITDASATVLAGLPELRELNVYRSRLTNAGLVKLQALPNLKILDLRYSDVTSSGVDAFSAARPGCKVIFVSATAPVSRAPGKERPKSLTAQGISSWIESASAVAPRWSREISTAISARSRSIY